MDLRQSPSHNIFTREIYFTKGVVMDRERVSIEVNVRITCPQPEAESLLEALKDLQRSSRQETGNLKFNILRSCNQPGDFLLTEEFEDEAAIATHRASSHFRRFKETTAPLRLMIE
eukprot:gene44995-60954_t